MHALDFFCGAGGLTRGLRDAGIDVVAGYDKDRSCEETYRSNNRGTNFFFSDIRELAVEDVHMSKDSAWLLAACAPCQPFSSQRRAGMPHQDAALLAHIGRLVSAAHPRYVLVENVPGIARVVGFSTFRRFLKTLSENKYHYTYRVLDAKHYGVPQTRRRLVLLASQVVLPSLPKATHGPQGKCLRTVRDVIGHFPSIEAGESNDQVPNHTAARIMAHNLERLRNTPVDGGDRRCWPDELVLDCHKKTKGYTDVYGRMAWERPAPTLTSKCNSISNGRFGHPEQNRAISLREAAAIQTFPDDYVFYGTSGQIAKQIGNAVPVSFARALGEHILELHRQLEHQDRPLGPPCS